MDKASFVREQLARVSIADFSKPDQVLLLCPFHDDHTPSLDVSLINIPGKVSVGGFNCWSCHEHGGWNKLAAKLGLESWEQKRYENLPDNPYIQIAADLAQLEKAQVRACYVKPHTEGLWEGSWRGLPGKFLRSVGCEAYWDRLAEEYRLWFPLFDLRQNLVGHIAARGEDSDISDKHKYLNSEGFPAKKFWYCLNYETAPRWIVIVEGPYDCLRFRAAGIPAVAVLGLGQLTDQKIMQILSQGCTRVILALDADTAGREATPRYAEAFKNFGFEVVDANLTRYMPEPVDPDAKMDPGSCPNEAVQDILTFIRQH